MVLRCLIVGWLWFLGMVWGWCGMGVMSGGLLFKWLDDDFVRVGWGLKVFVIFCGVLMIRGWFFCGYVVVWFIDIGG